MSQKPVQVEPPIDGSNVYHPVSFSLTPGRQRFGEMRAGFLFADLASKKILDFDVSLRRMLGYPKRELLVLRVTDLHPTEVLEKVERAYQEILSRSPQRLSEIPCRKANGKEFFADIEIRAVKSKREKKIIRAFFVDVTKRKREIEHLRELLREKEDVIKAQTEMILSLNCQGRILESNPFGENLLGYRKSRLVSQDILTLVPPEKRSEIQELFYRCLSGEHIRRFETELIKNGGSRLFVSLDLVPLIKDVSQERVDRVVAVVREIGEQKKLVNELLSAKKEAEELYQELREAYEDLKETQDELVRREKFVATGELAAGIAHEIRNPLSIINMSVQYVHGKLAPENPLREFTEAVIEKVNRLDRITKDLIQYGRPRELELRNVNIHRLIDSSLRLALVRCRAQGIAIQRNYARFLPPVKVDVEQMDEVLCNMITNALDVMVAGGRLTVTTKEDQDEKRLLIEIANTGKGVPPGNREKLFTPFFTTKPNGTGLGLAICQRIVNCHHGSISVESKINGPNKGTRFIISLPIVLREKEPSSEKTVDEPLVTQKVN